MAGSFAAAGAMDAALQPLVSRHLLPLLLQLLGSLGSLRRADKFAAGLSAVPEQRCLETLLHVVSASGAAANTFHPKEASRCGMLVRHHGFERGQIFQLYNTYLCFI